MAINQRARTTITWMLWVQRESVLPLALVRWMLRRYLYETERHSWKWWLRAK
jgi:hypothetical protein